MHNNIYAIVKKKKILGIYLLAGQIAANKNSLGGRATSPKCGAQSSKVWPR